MRNMYFTPGFELVKEEDGSFAIYLSSIDNRSILKGERKLKNPIKMMDGTNISKFDQKDCSNMNSMIYNKYLCAANEGLMVYDNDSCSTDYVIYRVMKNNDNRYEITRFHKRAGEIINIEIIKRFDKEVNNFMEE